MNIKGWPEKRDVIQPTYKASHQNEGFNAGIDECAKAVEGNKFALDEIKLISVLKYQIEGRGGNINSKNDLTGFLEDIKSCLIIKEVESSRPSSHITPYWVNQLIQNYTETELLQAGYMKIGKFSDSEMQSEIYKVLKQWETDSPALACAISHAVMAKVEATTGGKVALDDQIRKDIIASVRTYWSFDNNQQHTHTWHSRGDFIEWLNKYDEPEEKEWENED